MKKWLAILLVLTLIPMGALANVATIYKKVEGAEGENLNASYIFEVKVEQGDVGSIYVKAFNSENEPLSDAVYTYEEGLKTSSEGFHNLQTGESGTVYVQLKANEYVCIDPTHNASAEFSVNEILPQDEDYSYYPKSTEAVTGTVSAVSGVTLDNITREWVNSYNYISLSGAIADSNSTVYCGKDQRAYAEANLNVRLEGQPIDSKCYTVSWRKDGQPVTEMTDAGTYVATITGNRFVDYSSGTAVAYDGAMRQEVTFEIIPAPLTITLKADPTAAVGSSAPSLDGMELNVAGLLDGHTPKSITLAYDKSLDMAKAGSYNILVANYAIEGTLTSNYKLTSNIAGRLHIATMTADPLPDAEPAPTPTPAPNVPKTGDSSQLMLWAVLCTGSALCMGLLLRRRKRA